MIPATPYPIGKLPQADLVALLDEHRVTDPRVILGPGLGCDAAVVDMGTCYLVAKSDPITFATDELGWYVVHVNANDVACVGATPRWFIVTLLLPAGQTTPALVQQLFSQIRTACLEVGALLIGGHTEITHSLDRPIAVGVMLGEVMPERLIRSDGAQPEDYLLLTKGIAVEGSALLAREMATRLEGQADPALLARAAGFLHCPGISVLREARILSAIEGIHALHDPTEGGVATGIRELVQAAGCGARIEQAALPILPETATLCALLGLDPLGLIASGALLAAVAPYAVDRAVAALRAAEIPVAVIGRVTAAPELLLVEATASRPLPIFPRDELARLFD